MSEINEGIMKRVERKFEKGKNIFIARGLLSSLAILRATDMDGKKSESNELIARFLLSRGAEGEVFAAVQDTGSDGAQHTPDTVRVTMRSGVPTGALRGVPDDEVVIRATTDDILL